MRIIVAEDEERSRTGISRLVSSIDKAYTVVAQAADGFQALDLIRCYRPDTVLTDIKMPRMDGLTLIEAAHAESLCPHFAIISAYAEFEFAQKAISLGVLEYIVKPVTYDAVEQVLRKLDSLPRNAGYAGMRTDVHPLVTAVLSEIKENYSRHISLGTLARQLSVTPEYLSTLFCREMEQNFSLYLQNYRVEQAKRLLAAEGIKVYEAAARTGFSDVKYFCKVFKRVTGVSPAHYQRTAINI
jgi:two-component system response regulator YesN